MTQRRRPTLWPQPDASDGRPPGLPGPPDDGSRPLPVDEEPPPEPDKDPDDDPEEDCPSQEEIDDLRSTVEDLRKDVAKEEEKVAAAERKVAEAGRAIDMQKAEAAKAGLDVGRSLPLLPLGPAGPKLAAACIARTAGLAAGGLVATLFALGLAREALREAEQTLDDLRAKLDSAEEELAALEEKKRDCESRRGAAAPTDQSEAAEYRRK